MKKISTIAIISILLASTAGAVIPATAQASSDPAMGVAWEVENDITQFSHEEQHSDWIFGPQPSIWIGYANNLTDIANNRYRISVGNDLFVNITIPKSFLGVGNQLDSIQFWGVRSGPRAPFFGLEYNATSDRWNSLAFTYASGVEEPRASNFITLDSLSSEYSEMPDFYHVVFAITYQQAVVPSIFNTGMQVVDTEGRPVSPSWLTSTTRGEYGSPPIGFGVAVNPLDFSLPSYYYADIVDESHRILHYADVNDTFIVRMMSSAQIGEALIPFSQLTYDAKYLIKRNLTMPVGLQASEAVLFNHDVAWTETEIDLYPWMFLKVNSTDAYVLAGYLDVIWSWLDLGGGLGMWFPFITVIENSTINIGKYYVADDVNTGIFDARHRIQWSGYFTNETDLDPGFGFGGNIQPQMDLVTVLDVNGDPLYKRPEITEKETMKLAFRSAFIEAFVYDMAGNIASMAQPGQPLNLTLLVHRNINELNGSIIYEVPSEPTPARFNLTQEITNLTLEVQGSGMDGNETHYWRYEIKHTMVLDFKSNLATTNSQYRITMYLRGGTFLWSIVIPLIHLHVSDFEVSLGEDLSILKVQFSFDANAPPMVVDKATVKIGLIQNVRFWNGTAWDYPSWLNGTDLTTEEYNALVDSWTDEYRQADISSNTLWSPRHLRLGIVPSYTPPIWIVTENGAIDLDGNLFTTDDQYFVKRTGFWSDEGNLTINGMWVGVGFDPSPGHDGDEFGSSNWMGVVELNVWFEANETFYWYHASDGSPLTAFEIDDIQDVLWADIDNNIPAPGYEYVSWLSINRTLNLDDVPGIESGRWSTTWFAWGTTQTFAVAVSDTQATLAHFRAEYAGLLIFNDGIGPTPSAPDFSIVGGQVVTDEVTHLVLIDSVGSVELRRPFGATNNSGNVHVSPDTEVNFGVTITDVNVTIYPLRIEHSSALRGAWDFRESYEGSIGLNSTNFDYWVTRATIDEMSFDITFTVDMTTYDSEDPSTRNHAVLFKVDQQFGDWTLDDFDNSVLEGRSLAVNFFGVLATGTATRYTAGQRPVTDTNGASLDASYYQFGAGDTPYANVTMGGLPYTWGGDGHSTVHRSGSSTVPVGAFSIMFESASGNSVTNWKVDASMLFMTAGYKYWDGEDIICDPVFVAYTSALQTGITTTPPNGGGNPATLYLIVGGVVALVIIVCVMYRRRG
ncbi:MAG: hypothetical protein ACFFDV_02275 [Candidatus Thorarchaeota archaeon]